MTPQFPPTDWSVVFSLRESDPEAARRALAVLCEVYWHPIYAFARSRGMDRETAQDVTQGFFLHLLERDTFAKADPAKGRLRFFLLGAFRNFLSRERQHMMARKRSPQTPILSLDHEQAERLYQRQLTDHLTPEETYERHWARIVAGRAWKRLQAEQTRSGHEQRFRTLQAYLYGDEPEVPYQEAANALGMSVSAVKVTVHRLRREFGKWLRVEVRPTLAEPAESDDEVRYVLRLLETSRLGIDGAEL